MEFDDLMPLKEDINVKTDSIVGSAEKWKMKPGFPSTKFLPV